MTMAEAVSEITSRPYQAEHDCQRVRRFLLSTYPITPTGFNWEIRRWDGWNCHRADSLDAAELARLVHLWEAGDGTLVAVAHPEDEGTLFLEVHPDYRELEAAMLAWGEQALAVERDGRRQVEVFVFDYDAQRQRLLEQRGYAQTPYGGVTRRQRFGNRVLPPAEIAPGYSLRTTRPDDYAECERMAVLLNAAFRRSIHTGAEYWHFETHSPSFRHDLNFVAEAPDGSLAAHVGVTYDEVNRRCIFEPVCTHPDHQRKGLARVLMLEGMHRARALGATDAYVDTGDGMASNFLYEAVGFTEVYHGYIWRKEL